MPRPRTVFNLLEPQSEALRSPAVELLVGGDQGRFGGSHLLRLAAIQSASYHPGARILLLQRNSSDLTRDHLGGPTGLLQMLSDLELHGAVQKSSIEARFANGSSITWSGCAREVETKRLLEQQFDVLLIDRVDEVPETLYVRLRDGVMATVGPGRRIIATTRRMSSSGWVRSYWSNGGPESDRAIMEMHPSDLSPEMLEVEKPPSYRTFLDGLHGGQFMFPAHTEAMVDDIHRWVEGDWEHLAICVPSQHGKTEAGPRNAVPYILSRFPGDWCAITSYGAEIANSRSADARENFLSAGGVLKPGRRRVNEWITIAGGGCWSGGAGLGVGGSATWLFGDDWNKDWSDAVNATSQKKKRRWLTSTLRSRETMFSAAGRPQKLCLTNTRWDPGDLAGYALDKGHEAGESWAIRVLSAVYDPAVIDGYREKYPNFEIRPDWREEPGEPIWPDRRDTAAWESVRIQRGPIIFDTECQQKPRGAESGGLFKSAWFNRLDRDPAFEGKRSNPQVYERCTRAWDLAATAGGGDYTAGAKIGRLRNGHVINRHTVRAQLSPAGVRRLIAGVSVLDGREVDVRIPDDPAAGGKAAADAIVRFMREVWSLLDMRPPTIRVQKPRKGRTATMSAKAARARDMQSFSEPPGDGIPGGFYYVAEAWSPALSDVIGESYGDLVAQWPELAEIARTVRVVAGEWWTPWLREVESFTGEDGRTDDQVDATVDGFEEVAPPRSRMQFF